MFIEANVKIVNIRFSDQVEAPELSLTEQRRQTVDTIIRLNFVKLIEANGEYILHVSQALHERIQKNKAVFKLFAVEGQKEIIQDKPVALKVMTAEEEKAFIEFVNQVVNKARLNINAQKAKNDAKANVPSELVENKSDFQPPRKITPNAPRAAFIVHVPDQATHTQKQAAVEAQVTDQVRKEKRQAQADARAQYYIEQAIDKKELEKQALKKLLTEK